MQNSNSLTRVEKFELVQKLEMCIEVFDTKMARHCDDKMLYDVLAVSILKARDDLGYSMDDNKLAHIFSNIAEEVKKAIPNIRIGEIPIAINKGVLGDYGDFQGLSIVTVIKFLKSHYISPKRAEIAKQIQHKEEPKQILSKNDQMELAKTHIIEAFEKYKTTKSIPYTGVYLYRYLSEYFNVINYSKELKFVMYYDAAVAVVKTLRDESLTHPNTRLSNSKQITDLEFYIKSEPDKINCASAIFKFLDNEELKIKVKNESERIALKRFFDDLIEMETNITDLLTDEIN